MTIRTGLSRSSLEMCIYSRNNVAEFKEDKKIAQGFSDSLIPNNKLSTVAEKQWRQRKLSQQLHYCSDSPNIRQICTQWNCIKIVHKLIVLSYEILTSEKIKGTKSCDPVPLRQNQKAQL
jgi:hypothetical protein